MLAEQREFTTHEFFLKLCNTLNYASRANITIYIIDISGKILAIPQTERLLLNIKFNLNNKVLVQLYYLYVYNIQAGSACVLLNCTVLHFFMCVSFNFRDKKMKKMSNLCYYFFFQRIFSIKLSYLNSIAVAKKHILQIHVNLRKLKIKKYI